MSSACGSSAGARGGLLLPDADITERDWQMCAWQRLQIKRPRYAAITLDQALATPGLGQTVRAFAAQIAAQARDASQREAREARYGRRVEWTGYGHRPVRKNP